MTMSHNFFPYIISLNDRKKPVIFLIQTIYQDVLSEIHEIIKTIKNDKTITFPNTV